MTISETLMIMYYMNFRESTIDDCPLMALPIVHRDSGNITAIQNDVSIPFEIKRVYYLYDVPGGEERGGHAHQELSQLIVAASGAFDVELFDGKITKTVRLDRSYLGLYVIPGIWRELKNFSSGSVCLVLASLAYTPDDYIRDLSEFLRIKNDK